jgi:hypothetical protein
MLDFVIKAGEAVSAPPSESAAKPRRAMCDFTGYRMPLSDRVITPYKAGMIRTSRIASEPSAASALRYGALP